MSTLLPPPPVHAETQEPSAVTPPPVVAPPRCVNLDDETSTIESSSLGYLLALGVCVLLFVFSQTAYRLGPKTPAVTSQSELMVLANSVHRQSKSAQIVPDLVPDPIVESDAKAMPLVASNVVSTEQEPTQATRFTSAVPVTPLPIVEPKIEIEDGNLDQTEVIACGEHVASQTDVEAEKPKPAKPTVERRPAPQNFVNILNPRPINLPSLAGAQSLEEICGPASCESNNACPITTNMESLDTQLAWTQTPAEAYKLAAETDKLVFLIHVSGNFRIPGFT